MKSEPEPRPRIVVWWLCAARAGDPLRLAGFPYPTIWSLPWGWQELSAYALCSISKVSFLLAATYLLIKLRNFKDYTAASCSAFCNSICPEFGKDETWSSSFEGHRHRREEAGPRKQYSAGEVRKAARLIRNRLFYKVRILRALQDRSLLFLVHDQIETTQKTPRAWSLLARITWPIAWRELDVVPTSATRLRDRAGQDSHRKNRSRCGPAVIR